MSTSLDCKKTLMYKHPNEQRENTKTKEDENEPKEFNPGT